MKQTYWPVYGFNAAGTKRETIASMFSWSAAADLALHPERDGFEARNLYIGATRVSR